MSAVETQPGVPSLALSQVEGIAGQEIVGGDAQAPAEGKPAPANGKYVSPARKRQQKQLRKRPAMRLHVHILDKSFVLNVGKGTQDLKWLATVAAQRFDRMARPNGRMRQRESIRAGAGICRVVLPAEVRTPRSSPRPGLNEEESGWPYDFVHPKTKICDVLRNGDHVEISVDLDRSTRGIAPALQKEKAWCRVEDSGFQDYAFRNSQTSLEHRLKYEKTIRERAVRLKEAQAMLRREIANQLFGADVNASPQDIQRAFEEEIQAMAVPMFIRGAKQRAAINEHLRQAYDDICLTFRYYGGLGSKAEIIENTNKSLHSLGNKSADGKGGDDDNDETISFNEFMQFVKQSRIWDNDGGSEGLESSRAITLTTLKEVFRVVNSKMETGGGGARFRVRGDGEFDRSEFMEALIHLARHKFNKMFENNGAVQLEHLLSDFVCKHAKLLVPNEFRAKLAGSDSAPLILDNIEVFRFIFDKYADGKTAIMDRSAFLEVLCDVGMMAMVTDRKGKKIILHRRGAEHQSFRRGRFDDDEEPPDAGALTLEEVHEFLNDMANEGGGAADMEDNEEDERDDSAATAPGLVFVGFIEAIIRAGDFRWRFEADDLDHRVESTIQQLRRLQFEKTNRRYLPSGKS